jgi:hypothetical protein
MTDLDLAVDTLLAKTKKYNLFWDYFEGRHPLIYSQERLGDIFKNLNARFTQNWCAVVVDAVVDRIQLRRITVAENEAATKRLDILLDASDLTVEADDVHMAAVVCGESFVIAWPDVDGKPDAYYNDPRNVHVFYEADRPRVKRFACKWWIGDDGFRYLTLYYPDRLEYYKSRKPVEVLHAGGTRSYNEVRNGKSFVPHEDNAVNPYGIVTVFHFRRERRKISSELQNIIEPQDAVNKLLADMMVAAEFGAFKQRYIISHADPGRFRNAPNIIWDIPAGDGEGQATSVGEFEATPLNNYLEALDKWTNSIAIISRTPKHYFFGQGGDPSGEALIAMEAPLNKKAQKYIDGFTAPWCELAAFLLLLDGGGPVELNAIIPHFDAPQTVQPYTQALIRKEAVQAGVPLMWQMQQEGYTEEEMAELEEARQTAQAEQQATLAAAMTNAQRNFDQEDTGA